MPTDINNSDLLYERKPFWRTVYASESFLKMSGLTGWFPERSQQPCFTRVLPALSVQAFHRIPFIVIRDYPAHVARRIKPAGARDDGGAVRF